MTRFLSSIYPLYRLPAGIFYLTSFRCMNLTVSLLALCERNKTARESICLDDAIVQEWYGMVIMLQWHERAFVLLLT